MMRIRFLLSRHLHPTVGQGESYAPASPWPHTLFCAGSIRSRFPEIGHARRIVVEARDLEFEAGRLLPAKDGELLCRWHDGCLSWFDGDDQWGRNRLGRDRLPWDANAYLGHLGLIPGGSYWVRISRI